MARLRQSLGFLNGSESEVKPELTSQAEKDQINRSLQEQKVRFQRLGIDVEVRQSTAVKNHQRNHP